MDNEEQINEILNNFDFEKVFKTLEIFDLAKFTSVEDLKSVAKRLLLTVNGFNETASQFCFEAENNDNFMRLRFVPFEFSVNKD